MKYTRIERIARQILHEEYSDYKENDWHYDRQYKMLIKAMMKLLADEPARQVGEEDFKPLHDGEKYALHWKELFDDLKMTESQISEIELAYARGYNAHRFDRKQDKEGGQVGSQVGGQDKEQEIIKALSGEEIEDVPTFTSTEYPIEDYVVYDKEHSEKLEIRQEIIKAHTFEEKCTISECRINQLLEGAVWYRDWVRG